MHTAALAAIQRRAGSAIRAGVKRIGLDTFDEAISALTSFLRTILKDVGVITEGARRMTATVPDVLLALKRNGRSVPCGSS